VPLLHRGLRVQGLHVANEQAGRDSGRSEHVRRQGQACDPCLKHRPGTAGVGLKVAKTNEITREGKFDY
jgi:hypothetical protein